MPLYATLAVAVVEARKTAALPSGEIGCGTPHHCDPISQLAIEPAELLEIDHGPRPGPK
jgi:hypothetical protein